MGPKVTAPVGAHLPLQPPSPFWCPLPGLIAMPALGPDLPAAVPLNPLRVPTFALAVPPAWLSSPESGKLWP